MKTVLIVDRSEAIREVTALLLEDRGLYARCVASSKDALRLLETGLVFHLAIIDTHVDHGIDGVELMHILHARYPGIKLIMISADRLGADETRQAGVPFLSKPFSRRQLLDVIAEVEVHV